MPFNDDNDALYFLLHAKHTHTHTDTVCLSIIMHFTN